jgi:hypothetical protein
VAVGTTGAVGAYVAVRQQYIVTVHIQRASAYTKQYLIITHSLRNCHGTKSF